LSDGNEFIKSFWTKSNLTAEALQPDVDGGNGATALYSQNIANTEESMKHFLGTSSHLALKTLRLRAKRGERRYLWIGGPISPGVSAGAAPYVVFDLLDGVVSTKFLAEGNITPVKDAWYDLEVTLVSGTEFWFGVASSLNFKQGGPYTNKPLAWIQAAQVEQSYVTVWKDRISALDFKAENIGFRWLSSTPEFNGAPSLESYFLSGASMAAGAAADWQFLHDGSGGSIVILQRSLVVNGVVFPRSIGTEYTGGEQGMRLGLPMANAKVWSYGVSNESGENVFTTSGGTTAGTRWLAGSYATSQSPNAQLFDNGTMVSAAAEAASPTDKPGSGPLKLGDKSSSPSQKVSEVIVYRRALTAADVAHLKLYFDPQFGE
jgi:hypothetical protein